MPDTYWLLSKYFLNDKYLTTFLFKCIQETTVQVRLEMQKNFINLISNIAKCVSEYGLDGVFIKKGFAKLNWLFLLSVRIWV